jgi:hypothetical protein
MPPVVIGASANVQVTFDSDPNRDRSESALAISPLEPLNMVGASKLFKNPGKYDFTLAAYATSDGGSTWEEASELELLKGWGRISDPALAWDDLGNAYLVALPVEPGADPKPIGIVVYQSKDGGRTWSSPEVIHTSSTDDKQAAVGDGNSASPHFGNVYAVWDDGGIGTALLRFARTTDNGANWLGVGSRPRGTEITGVTDSGSPEPVVAADGTLYVVWTAGTDIKFVTSTDGGDSFSKPAGVATGITPLESRLPAPDGSPELPGGKFRVGTIASVAVGLDGALTVAWPDYREGVSRIYYRTSPDGGTTWPGNPSGDPLLTGAVASLPTQHDFHPQLASTPTGEIGCAFYEFGPVTGRGPSLINVVMAASVDNGVSFPYRVTVTDQPWDPAVDAPLSHGRPTTTFIGDYFGLAASSLGFFPFWTDTRTGIQEVFTARVGLIR